MQKLLRPTYCSAPILSLSVGGTATSTGTLTLPSSSTPITTLPFSFSISLSLSSSPHKYIAMATAAPSFASSLVSLPPTTSASCSASKSFPLCTLPSSFLSAMPRCLSLTHKHTAARAPIHRLPWLLPRCASFYSASEGEGEDTKEHKPVSPRLNRRQRAYSSSSPILPNPDLLAIPGVGPRNLRKLVQKGIAGVAQLKQLYKDKFFGKSSDKMVEYLQSSVGIIHKNHAESITTFIKKSVDEELEDNSSSAAVQALQKKRLTFCVEGNISVGKTTFLQRIANETIELRDLVEVVPEPISKWQDVGPDHFNILDAFYAEPQRYAYTFQNYVFVTRVMQERESSGGIKPLRLMERSVFSDRMVFVRAVHEANWMNEMEISIYDSWFDPVVSSLPGLIPDGFIYLRASPDTCHKRMKLRKRAEEGGVSLDYLRDLHEKHESWLFPFQSGNHGILSVNKLPQHVDNSLHPEIRDRVFYLEGDHMHSSIQKVPYLMESMPEFVIRYNRLVPALVLDCEPNIDFSKDVEAKRQTIVSSMLLILEPFLNGSTFLIGCITGFVFVHISSFFIWKSLTLSFAGHFSGFGVWNVAFSLIYCESESLVNQERYARQVAEFFEFVKKKNEVSSKEGTRGKQNGEAEADVLMPHEGALWLPDGKPFPQGAHTPLDFRRAMSFMSG
ncbi:hypothetical protein Ahy_A01g003730 [Arachis hypogaea]|uniref:Deoxynucleoside kinase domain-containing protein n=1 Tax=Arachis hypogaea TaxID=3818 RepID=A0A445ETN5_ARAHY|nr:hypothetical protein Ahy_A01g003730 [Arachis hypogaea]